MKKIFVYTFIFLFFTQGLSYSFDINTVRNYLFTDAIENTIKKIDTTNTDPITTVLVNKTKVSALKKQLELQQQQLAEIEASSDFFVIKWYRKKQVNDKIADIENQIKELENQ